MPNGQIVNPLAALATTARQVGEQANATLKGLGDSLTQTTSQLLATAAQAPGLPGLPGLPAGIPGLTAARGSSHRGNPNGNQLFPTPQQLVPAGLLQAFSGIEDVVIPRGLPRPSQVLLGVTPARRPGAPVAEVPVTPMVPVAVTERVAAGVEGAQRPAAIRRPSRALGIQAV